MMLAAAAVRRGHDVAWVRWQIVSMCEWLWEDQLLVGRVFVEATYMKAEKDE